MTKETAVKLFEQKQVRSVWNEDEEQWYFSIVDVIAVLTDSVNPTDYLKKIRKRDSELGSYLGTNCPQLARASRSCQLTKAGKAVKQNNLK
jgi:hypothetical protein